MDLKRYIEKKYNLNSSELYEKLESINLDELNCYIYEEYDIDFDDHDYMEEYLYNIGYNSDMTKLKKEVRDNE